MECGEVGGEVVPTNLAISHPGTKASVKHIFVHLLFRLYACAKLISKIYLDL